MTAVSIAVPVAPAIARAGAAPDRRYQFCGDGGEDGIIDEITHMEILPKIDLRKPLTMASNASLTPVNYQGARGAKRSGMLRRYAIDQSFSLVHFGN
ncbi:hypothetical protein IQ782_18270 [Salipiger pacificus]|uniref:Uncharacterized protein n=1 Tax=Salipiger mangrovisoli TaxID=2865933 RepID=A0ABR9X5C4_9RHOB|nr:hypothetical protein [Salipiger mangrovisoli]